MTILEALDDPNLLGAAFTGDSWSAWRAFLAATFFGAPPFPATFLWVTVAAALFIVAASFAARFCSIFCAFATSASARIRRAVALANAFCATSAAFRALRADFAAFFDSFFAFFSASLARAARSSATAAARSAVF